MIDCSDPALPPGTSVELRATLKDLISVEILRAENYDCYEVRCWLEARDINTGKPTRVWRRELTRGIGEYSKVTKSMVRDAIVKLLEHEVEECLFINGEQAFDPHSEDAK